MSILSYSQIDNKEIIDLKVYSYPYSLDYSMSPSIEQIKTRDFGLYIQTTDYREMTRSKLILKLQELEKRPSEVPYIDEEGERESFWTTKAFATIHFSDSTKEELFIMKRGIVWKNRRYENYYPLIESVYYFFPDRYYAKEHYRKIEEGNVE